MESRSSLQAKHNVISWLTTMTFENSFMIPISKAESSYLEISLLKVPTRCNESIPLPLFSEKKKKIYIYNMVIIIISLFMFRLEVQRTKITRQGKKILPRKFIFYFLVIYFILQRMYSNCKEQVLSFLWKYACCGIISTQKSGFQKMSVWLQPALAS